jgi:uncharacterized phage protein gp47/JayE
MVNRLNYPTQKEIATRQNNALIDSVNTGEPDIEKHIDPTLENSVLKGIVDALTAGISDNYNLVKALEIQLFPQTATGTFLNKWLDDFGVVRVSAAKAQGSVVFTGTASTVISAATNIQKTDGTLFETINDTPITTETILVDSITRLGSIATVTTTNNHNLATGVSATITGANEADYNITATISVTGLNTFTYTVANNPSTPATGTILTSANFAHVAVRAVEFGTASNSAAASQLSLVSAQANVDNIAVADFNGIRGGLDLESDESVRSRLLFKTSNMTNAFSSASIEFFIKNNFPTITRVWVQDATPSAGYVTIYFTEDSEVNIIPTGAKANAVKSSITTGPDKIKPANTPDSFVLVSGPTAVTQNFEFSTLSPNTQDMRDSLTEALKDYFRSGSVNVETNVNANQYNSVISNVIDSSGNSPTYTLLAPLGNISVGLGQLALLGTITYPGGIVVTP